MTNAAVALESGPAEQSAKEAPVEDNEPERRSGLGWMEYVTITLIAVAASCAVFIGGWLVFAKPAYTKIGVIDLGSIVELEELSLTSSMTGSQVTDEDRVRAFDRVKSFGTRLEGAIEQARKECDCVLLTRNAMVGQTGADQTDRVKQLLGMGSTNAAELREKISRNVQALPDGLKR